MVAVAYTVAFEGITARMVEVQCAVVAGLPAFAIVGLPDKAVSEARERVRAAITALNAIPADEVARHVCLGELSLSGDLVTVLGTLPAALAAAEAEMGLICPNSCGQEAAWVGACQVTAPSSLLAIMNHLNGKTVLPNAEPGRIEEMGHQRDLADVKGQERAKRALEISAAGRHHFLLVGSPGSGKSMMARRLPSILPHLSAEEALETSMVHSVAGLLGKGGISYERPFMSPHHTASMPAIVGGGRNAKPGEISLAHHGVLFMDEFPEFPRAVLETLRQPLETGDVVISRANAHVRYPCKFLLIAAGSYVWGGLSWSHIGPAYGPV